MKAHRQYVKEQIKKDPRMARDLEETRGRARLTVMIARLREKKSN